MNSIKARRSKVVKTPGARTAPGNPAARARIIASQHHEAFCRDDSTDAWDKPRLHISKRRVRPRMCQRMAALPFSADDVEGPFDGTGPGGIFRGTFHETTSLRSAYLSFGTVLQIVQLENFGVVSAEGKKKNEDRDIGHGNGGQDSGDETRRFGARSENGFAGSG